jgi:hypothetical protein
VLYSPVGLRLMESVIDGEGPLFAEMRCDLSVVRKNLEAGAGGLEGRGVSLHTDHSVSCSIGTPVLPTWLQQQEEIAAS